MSESSLWSYVRDKILLPDVHATRIENGVSAGFPDVHATWREGSATLELKFLRKKKFPLGADGLNIDQEHWIRDELGARGRVWIIVEGEGHIFIVHGRAFPSLNEWTIKDYHDAAFWEIKKGSPPDKGERLDIMRMLFTLPF